MTEQEWLGATFPSQLFYHGVALSKRKARLALCGCARRVLRLLRNDPLCFTLIHVCEHYAEGPKLRGTSNWSSVIAARKPLNTILSGMNRDCSANKKLAFAYQAVVCASEPFNSSSASLTFDSIAYAFEAAKRKRSAYSAEQAVQFLILRDIFGNPFRPLTFDADWSTSTAAALAKQMYDSRDFGAMPILADALQDAGCEVDDILNHCRDANATHVRGCWVVDLVLGFS